MLTRPTALKAFLATARRALTQHQRVSQRAIDRHALPPLGFVTGNESCDLDSATSALLYAYFRSYRDVRHPRQTSPRLHVPVLNIPRRDVRIRPELVRLLDIVGVSEGDLVTGDEVAASLRPMAATEEGESREEEPDIHVILVDHNKPVNFFSGTTRHIHGCVDHHVDEGVIPSSANPRIITLEAGSCTSLVVQDVRTEWDELSASAQNSGAANAQADSGIGTEDEAMRRGWDAQLAKLALASILIDTNNLQDSSKTRDVDREGVAYLTAKIDLAPPGKGGGVFDRQRFFEDIREAKSNLDALSVEQVLRKDYKEFEIIGKRLGTSSVVKPLSWMARKAETEGSSDVDGLASVLKAFAHERRLDVFVVLTAAVHGLNNEFQRELMIHLELVGSDGSGIEKPLPRHWQSRLEEALKLEPSQEARTQANGAGLRIWRQHDLSKSRKQIAPFLRDMMGEAAKLDGG
ncbi:MAG: hypothetical protein Q9162_004361 [Coniocarpon cinnabarinum]